MKKAIITFCLVISLLLVGGFAYNYSTSHEEYSDEKLQKSEKKLLSKAKSVMDLDVNSYYVSNLESLDDILKDHYNADDYEKVSDFIYSEYYNEDIERKPNTLILIGKKFDTVSIISEDSTGNIVYAESILNDSLEKGWNYR